MSKAQTFTLIVVTYHYKPISGYISYINLLKVWTYAEVGDIVPSHMQVLWFVSLYM